MGFNCLTKVYDSSNQAMFRKQRKKFEDPSATVITVWNIIGEYVSFFDYEILELIVNILGESSDKENFDKYTKDFETYARKHLIIKGVSSSNDSDSSGESTPMFVVLDSSFDDCEIGHLKRLQIKLSEVLNMKKGILQLYKVKEGSIQLVFKIPAFISDRIFPLSPGQESALQELGVIVGTITSKPRFDCLVCHKV